MIVNKAIRGKNNIIGLINSLNTLILHEKVGIDRSEGGSATKMAFGEQEAGWMRRRTNFDDFIAGKHTRVWALGSIP
jgi:hypothetical protein